MIPISVLWPVATATFGYRYNFPPNLSRKTTPTRSWLSRSSVMCTWYHEGVEIQMKKANGTEVLIPVLSLSDNVLPYNNKIMHPFDTVVDVDTRVGRDILARLYTIDPVNTVPTAAAQRDAVCPLPVTPVRVSHSVFQNRSVRQTQSLLSSATVTYSIPPHVKKLVVADAISRKECCPISCEDISQENAGITSCGHVFVLSEIQRWLSMASSKGLCPVCKQGCSL